MGGFKMRGAGEAGVLLVFGACCALLSCRGPEEQVSIPAPKSSLSSAGGAASVLPAATSSQASPPPSASASASGASVASAASAAGPLPSASASAKAGEALSEDCRLIRGPARLSMIGPATLIHGAEAGGIQVLWNREGKPSLETPVFSAPRKENGAGPSLFPKKSGPETSAAPNELLPQSTQDKALAPACAVVGSQAYCMNREGLIHRTNLRGEGQVFMAKGRPGTPMAAASFGVSHTFLAFLANQKTTEGVVTQAFAVLDQGPPILLSEEGSGATFIELLERQHDVLAMYIDARVAMTPLHARSLSSDAGKIKLGRDSVVYVGDGSDRRSSGAIGWTGKGPAYLLMPTTSLEGKFGVVAVRADEEPKDDAPSVHSPYAKEIRPIPMAATVGLSPVRVLRVRPVSAEAEAWKVLELGHLDENGVFKPQCNLLESRSFSDVEIAGDDKGSLWIVYASADGMWIEQRGK